MSAATHNAKRRLRRRVDACAYNPPPREIVDIATLLAEIKRLEQSTDEAWTLTRKAIDAFMGDEK